MDAVSLQGLFQATYSPDPNTRKAAELQIRSLEGQEGFPTAVLQIIAEGQDLPVRQACAVYLKNRIARSWDIDPSRPRPNQIVLSPTDKISIKQNVLRVLHAAPTNTIRVQVAALLGTIVSCDVPDEWPQFLDSVLALLRSPEQREQFAGQLALLEVVKAWRYRHSKKEFLYQVIEQTFPVLVEAGSRAAEEDSLEAGSMLHVIFKIYKASMINGLSAHQQQTIVPWGTLFLRVVSKKVPAHLLPADEDERERSPWAKAKKFAFHDLNRLFARFGSPSQLSSRAQEYKPFAETFVAQFAPEILKVYLQQIELSHQGVWLSNKGKYFIFDFLSECIKPKSTWQLLKPHVHTLVAGFAFPELCFSAAQAELWETDPVEFIRGSIDPLENFNAPAASATAFLLNLTRSRNKATFEGILGFVNTVLAEYPAKRTAQEKYGALAILVALSSVVMRSKAIGNAMEGVFVQHVLPEFKSPHGYLRLIANEMVQKYETWDIKWTNKANLEAHFRAVVESMADTELPVRVLAALALTEQIQHKEVQAAMGPNIARIVQDILKLSDEIDLDTLSQTMERIVDDFGEQLLPFAADMSRHLGESYMRIMREQLDLRGDTTDETDLSNVNLDGSEDKVMAAMSILKTMQQLVRSLEGSKPILQQITQVSIPLVLFTLQNEFIELYDEVFELVDSLTFFLREIPNELWAVFEAIYTSFKGSGIDFLGEMINSLDNFISFGTAPFAQNPAYRQMALDIFDTAMKSEQLGEHDRIAACQLAESLLANLPGHFDDAVPVILRIAIEHLGKTKTKALRLNLLETIINALHYNPVLSLAALEQAGATTTFFQAWLNNAQLFSRVHDKKVAIVGICALMQLTPDQTPASVQQGWPALFGGLLQFLETLPIAIQSREELEAAFTAGPDEDDDDDDFDVIEDVDVDDDEDDVLDEDNEYLEFLAEEGARLRERQEAGRADDDEEDFGYDEDDLAEELTFESPLDKIDAFIRFKNNLAIFQSANPAAASAASAALTPEQQAQLSKALQHAAEREAAGATA